MPKESRRVKMTKALLNESFLGFLEQKPVSRITVKEICEAADVNRSTYYVYYTDPYDQLNKLEESLLQEQAVYMEEILAHAARQEASFTAAVEQLLRHYQGKKRLLQVLLGKCVTMQLEYKLLKFLPRRF